MATKEEQLRDDSGLRARVKKKMPISIKKAKESG
jgi:hypothetical protein